LAASGSGDGGAALLARAQDDATRAARNAFSFVEAAQGEPFGSARDDDDDDDEAEAGSAEVSSLPSFSFSAVEPRASPGGAAGSGSVDLGDSEAQQLGAVAGLEAVAPVKLASAMALAAAAQVMSHLREGCTTHESQAFWVASCVDPFDTHPAVYNVLFYSLPPRR
jgi:hypothetical protein